MNETKVKEGDFETKEVPKDINTCEKEVRSMKKRMKTSKLFSELELLLGVGPGQEVSVLSRIQGNLVLFT